MKLKLFLWEVQTFAERIRLNSIKLYFIKKDKIRKWRNVSSDSDK